MLEHVPTARGEFVRRSFIVNVRSHHIPAHNGVEKGVVKLKAPRETTQEAWAWDDLLTLEFNGVAPAVSSVEIEPVVVPTIFLLGDSTVCDQSREPYNSWGQMLPAFFTDQVAIANHGESGETYRDSIGRRRLDKIISVMKPGDWLLMQFGHNDQKQIAAGTGGLTTYQDEMRTHIAAVRKVGGIPVVVSPMERHAFDENGHVRPSLADYARASREVAEQERVAFIDLHAMSVKFYESLGPERAAQAFAAPNGVVDNTHHNNYGSYQLARCVVQGVRDAKLAIAKFISPEVSAYDPAQPDAPERFPIPPSPLVTTQRPLGD
jgi:lysophospholipase L1-like esterase